MTSRTHFSISVPPSVASSRSASPAPSYSDTYGSDYQYNKTNLEFHKKQQQLNAILGNGKETDCPGQRSTDVYDRTLPAWRARVRRMLVRTVEKESRIIAKMQNAIRTPWLDSYFVYTSLLGTHTFFMILLPAFAFFGHQDIARGLVMVLAAGVYFSSVLKDMFCSPRPFAPPVVRLTIGSHHLEYGFPSTHSTNSISIALFFFSIFHSLAFPTPSSSSPFSDSTTSSTIEPTLSKEWFYALTAMLAFYAFSIVFGRLYTAMHSFTDCAMGIVLGAGIWWGHSSWGGHPILVSSSSYLYDIFTFLGLGTPSNDPSSSSPALLVHLFQGLGLGKAIESWSESPSLRVPLILIPLCLLLVNQHPQPVDDCPCFEDAIAFGSVVLGVLLGRWGMSGVGWEVEREGLAVMRGSGWVWEAVGEGMVGEWVKVERTWGDVGVWGFYAFVKLFVGILTIFVWRILAKSALHLTLPPLFRLLSRAFQLPNRRFYTPATEYKNVPSDISVGEDGSIALHAIPSVIDLSLSGGIGGETGGIGSGVDGASSRSSSSQVAKREVRKSGLSASVTVGEGEKRKEVRFKRVDEEEQVKGVKHYDADVLTKVIVYAGIAFLACEALPLFFEYVGWGLRYWV